MISFSFLSSCYRRCSFSYRRCSFSYYWFYFIILLFYFFFKNNLFTCDHKVQECARAMPVTPRPAAPGCASLSALGQHQVRPVPSLTHILGLQGMVSDGVGSSRVFQLIGNYWKGTSCSKGWFPKTPVDEVVTGKLCCTAFRATSAF